LICTVHKSTESVRKCPKCKQYLCHRCIDVGHCKNCGWIISQNTNEMVLIKISFWSLLIVVWVALIGFGYTYSTQFSSNGPIYFIALTTAIFPLYTVLHHSFKHYMEAGWVGKKHIGLVIIFLALAIVLFRFGVIPLSSIDID
jgi:hypothetical protein